MTVDGELRLDANHRRTDRGFSLPCRADQASGQDARLSIAYHRPGAIAHRAFILMEVHVEIVASFAVMIIALAAGYMLPDSTKDRMIVALVVGVVILAIVVGVTGL